MSSSITINSNLSSLNAQRRFSAGTKALSDTFTRLSSGLRINKASDDAAGLAISESLKTDQRVFHQGVRNLNDGVSLISIADGALSELSSIVMRLTELSEQSANGTLGHAQRKALDQEAQALKAEYFRIAQSTEFNGRKLFAGDFGELRLQAGYGEQGGIVSGLGGAIGTGEFEDREIYATGDDPFSVTLGDVNGDGVLDIVTVDRLANSTSILLGRGDGSFAPRVSYGTGTNPRSVTLGDVNRDGVLDIVTADYLSDAVSVLLGREDGSFAPRASYVTGNRPRSVTLGDANGDGILDIVTADFSSSTVSVLLGQGDGSFVPRISYATGSSPITVALGDVNSDGVLDIITADRDSDSLSVLLGRGDGSFAPRLSFAPGDGPVFVALGDVNGDGILDIVTTDYNSNSASVLLGRGDGSFTPRVSYQTGGLPISVTLGDVNGDGILDIVTADGGSNAVSVLLGRGDGSFTPRVSYQTGAFPISATLGDVNGDGVLDIAVADATNSVSVLLATTTDGVAPLLDFSLATQADARQALPVFKRKLDQLAAHRGQLGALEARLSTAVATLRVTKENVSAAASQISDADVAAESATLVRNQIVQQAGAAVLAQANQQPAIALRLLQGVA